MLINAADFGPSARLVAMGDARAVLVDLGNGSFRVAAVPSGEIRAVPYGSWPLPASTRRPIAISESQVGSELASVFVLACDALGTCEITSADWATGELSAWRTIELPNALAATGLVFDGTTQAGAICAFGRGLSCFRGGWKEEIKASASLRLHDVAIGSAWSIAVGERGRWFKRERTDSDLWGPWQEQPALGEVALTRVSVAGAGALILGAGMIQLALGIQAHFLDCGLGEQLQDVLLDTRAEGAGYVLTRDGAVLQHSPLGDTPYCAHDRVMGSPIAMATAPCSDALNPRVLSERALVGANACYHLF